MTPCPYCATALFPYGPVVQCKGCGNPVAIGAVQAEIIRLALVKPIEPERPVAKIKLVMRNTVKFPGVKQLKKAANE